MSFRWWLIKKLLPASFVVKREHDWVFDPLLGQYCRRCAVAVPIQWTELYCGGVPR